MAKLCLSQSRDDSPWDYTQQLWLFYHSYNVTTDKVKYGNQLYHKTLH